jgi:hypothetical protein
LFYNEDRDCSDADTCSLSNFIEQLVTQEAFEGTKTQNKVSLRITFKTATMVKVFINKIKDLDLFPLISYYFEHFHYREIIGCKSKSEKIISRNLTTFSCVGSHEQSVLDALPMVR